MQSTTSVQHGASGLPKGDLLTIRALNKSVNELREAFEGLGERRPLPFIRWAHGLNAEEAERLQLLLAGGGTKGDVDLLDKAWETLKQMRKGHLKAAA